MSELLKKGSEGIEVANWQRFLVAQGYDLDADGDFGAKTEAATRAFQASQDLRGDGIVGEMTFAAAEKMKVATVGSVKPSPKPQGHSNINKVLEVHPELQNKVLQILQLSELENYHLQITQGLRTFAEQDKLFTKRPKVTNARGGQSMHNYGLAVDFAFVVNGKISWDEKLYKNIGRWADAVGLEWGGNWTRFKDLPHVQLKGLPSYKVLLPIYQKGGLKAVWDKYKG